MANLGPVLKTVIKIKERIGEKAAAQAPAPVAAPSTAATAAAADIPAAATDIPAAAADIPAPRRENVAGTAQIGADNVTEEERRMRAAGRTGARSVILSESDRLGG